MIDDKKPTVTVSVTTYNSAKYVAETLESIKNQSYPNLILQISDDCSTDNTIDICKSWINKNKDRFVKTKIIVPESNTGVTGNCNRAWDACETRYFKGIAGDDLLLPYCIEKTCNMSPNTQRRYLSLVRFKFLELMKKEILLLKKCSIILVLK